MDPRQRLSDLGDDSRWNDVTIEIDADHVVRPARPVRRTRLRFGIDLGIALVAVAALVAFAVGGWFVGHPAFTGPAVTSTVSSQVDCRAALASFGMLGDTIPRPDPPLVAERIPTGFHIVSAVTCEPTRVTDAQGAWSAVKQTTYSGDFSEVEADLRKPDDPAPTGDYACALVAILLDSLWVIDDSGDAVLVQRPATYCGDPHTDADQALSRLTVVATTVTKVALVETRAEIDSGCGSSGKYIQPNSSGRVDPRDVEIPTSTTARVCVFTFDGDFVSGRVLSGADVARAWNDARSGAPAAACDEVPTKFGTLTTADDNAPGPFDWVELDGCRRVYTQTGPARQASAALLALFG